MTQKILPLLLLLWAGCSTQEAPPRGAGDQLIAERPTDPRLDEAEALLQRGDPDGALAITDDLLKENPDHVEARLLAARGNIGLFESGRQGAQWFLEDAVRNLEAALDERPDHPQALLALSWCKLRQSEFESGVELAVRAAEVLRDRGAPANEVGAALMQAAEHEMQIFTDARRAELAEGVEQPSSDVIELGQQVLARCATAEQLGMAATARVRAAQVHQWLNRHTDALEMLERAVLADPASGEVNVAFQELYWNMDMRAECVAAYKRLLKSAPGSTALLFYLGRAQAALGDSLRTKTQWSEAEKAYGDALATFRRYSEAHPDHDAVTSHWLALCELSLGKVALQQGRLDEAKQHYFAAYEADPRVADYVDGMPAIYDPFGGNYQGGLFEIGVTIAEQADPNALRDSLAFFEEVIAKHPDRFGAIYNNAALSARDLGVQVARRGQGENGTAEASADPASRRAQLEEAMALWEKSYAYYEKAVELEPNDPRIVNDCGLMLIYHLNRDFDRARELFDRAIELGEQQLAALPADVSPAQRNDLEEATGDAYQNVGVLLADHLDRPDEARPFFEKAVEFYPYQQRDAARRLRTTPSGADTATRQDPRKPKFDAAIAKAKKSAADGDYDAALLVIDDLGKEMAGYAPFHHLAGLWSFRLAEKAAAEGRHAGLIDGLFQDAVRHLKRAVELDADRAESRLALARALLSTGAAAEAARVADELLSHLRSEGTASAEQLVEVHALRAEAAARAFVEKKQAGESDDELLRMMRTSFREIETTERFDAQKRSTWVAAEQWAEAPGEALQIVVRAWQRDPKLVGELVDAGARLGASEAVVEALEPAADATSLWYAGKASFDHGVQLWSAGEPDLAITALEKAIAKFEAAMAANPDFRDSSEQWVALSLGQKAIVQISKDEIDAAAETLAEAIETRRDVFTNDLGGGSSIKRGVLIVGDRYLKSDLGKAAAFYRRIGALVPDDVDIANNEGLFTRDHADRLGGRRGELTEQTRDLYEASYAAYTRASELEPTNVRLRNDRALILVYSLKRDLDLAEQLLKSAIEDGEKQLAESPPEDADELRNLQEAVGDAYGNLAVLYEEQGKLEEAKTNAEKSLEFYPFRQRVGARLLPRIEARLKEQQEQGSGETGKKDGGE